MRQNGDVASLVAKPGQRHVPEHVAGQVRTRIRDVDALGAVQLVAEGGRFEL